MVAQGYKAQKWFFRYGPSDGLEGMLAQRRRWCERSARPSARTIEIMFDCFMGGDATYITRQMLCERIEEYYTPRWVEEPVPPDPYA